MGKLKLAINLVLALAAAGILPMLAAPIGTGTWYNFKTEKGVDYGGGIDFATGHSEFAGFYENPGASPWTFTSPLDGSLFTVLDGGELGDVYNVWDFGTLIGTTSNVTPDAYSCGDLPEPCLADALMSKGTFVLGPGEHSITISIQSTPYENSFLSWFRLDDAPAATEIPEPGTAALVGAGLLLIGRFAGYVRSKKSPR